MTISEAKHKIPAVEFLCWAKIINDEWDEKSKRDHYDAQLCYHIHYLTHIVASMFAKDPKKFDMKPEDFLITFTTGKPPVINKVPDILPDPEPMKDEEIVAYTKDGRPMNAEQKKYADEQRQFWLGALGMDADGKMTGPIKTRKPPVVEPGRNNPVIRPKSKKED